MSIPLPPVFAAPLAGGPGTPDLVIAALAGGGSGFLAAGYRTAAELREEMARVRRAAPDAAWGVNLFVPAPPRAHSDADALDRYRVAMTAEAERRGIPAPSPAGDPSDGWAAKMALLEAEPPAWVSTTFGLPPLADAERLRAAGIALIATVTTPTEAAAAIERGAAALCVQGPAAGGHRATFRIEDRPDERPLAELLAACVPLGVPCIAAGGIAGPTEARAARSAGAVAVQIGTALLRSPEAGTAAIHRDALVNWPDGTRLTRAYTGRWARGLSTAFMDRFDPVAPAAYPEVHELTRGIRAAARAQGDAQAMSLWAGTAHARAEARAAAEIVAEIAAVMR